MAISQEKMQEWIEKKVNSEYLAQQFLSILETPSGNLSKEVVETCPIFANWLEKINLFIHTLNEIRSTGVWEEK